MPIENRNLGAGTRLVAQYKGKDRSCEVVLTDDGVRYRLDDGTEYNSPSSAGRAVTGGVAVNGWKFWSVAGEGPVRKPKAEKAAKKSKTVKPKAKKGGKEERQEEGGAGGERRFVRVRRLRRDVPDAQGRDATRAHARAVIPHLLQSDALRSGRVALSVASPTRRSQPTLWLDSAARLPTRASCRGSRW